MKEQARLLKISIGDCWISILVGWPERIYIWIIRIQMASTPNTHGTFHVEQIQQQPEARGFTSILWIRPGHLNEIIKHERTC